VGYPAHWEADVVLRDGSAAHLRPILPGDAETLVAFYARVSAKSKYYRFFAAYPELSEGDVQRFTTVDHRRRVAFVVTVGTQIIAVGRYDCLDGARADVAEVAFLVEDAHQGRGLGQLLLEHLAQAGRERGVRTFVADVLPNNTRMIQNFRAAGYQLESGYEEGVMHLVFPIEATQTAVGVMRAREHRAEARSVERILTASSVAVVGSGDPGDAMSEELVRNLVAGGYTGRIYPVDPAVESVDGVPAFASVRDIPGPVDLALVAVPAPRAPEVVLDCAAKGVHGLVVVSGGYADTGDEGRVLQRRLVGQARAYGLRVIGPNCLGVINTSPGTSLNASLSPVMPPHGRIGFFCQSGALGAAILRMVERRGIGLSTFVSAGNRADVSGNDVLQFWAEDVDTQAVLLCLESIGNPRKFSHVARRVASSKPVVAVKSASTSGGPVGHAVRRTSAPPAAVDAMFRQAGVIQVDTLDEMFDVAQLVAYQPLPRGPRVAVVDNSSELGLMACEAAVSAGLEVRGQGHLVTGAPADAIETALREAMDAPDVDAVLAVLVPERDADAERFTAALTEVAAESRKPLCCAFLAADGVTEMLPPVSGTAGTHVSVPSYPAPEQALRALARVVGYSRWLARPPGRVGDLDRIDENAARRIVDGVLAGASVPPGAATALDAETVRDLLAAYGIELWQQIPVTTCEQAVAAGEQLGWGVVLKATAPRLRRRADFAHVWRNIDTDDQMEHAWAALSSDIAATDEAGFVVQRMAGRGVPVTIRSVEDPLFGPIVSFGVEGIASAMLHDWAYRIPPLTDVDAAEMIREIKAAPLLAGHPHGAAVDTGSLEELIQRVARLKHDIPEVEALDLTLVLAGSFGTRTLGASARVARVAEGRRAESFVRRLTTPPD